MEFVRSSDSILPFKFVTKKLKRALETKKKVTARSPNRIVARRLESIPVPQLLTKQEYDLIKKINSDLPKIKKKYIYDKGKS